jgi:hypothetical protein
MLQRKYQKPRHAVTAKQAQRVLAPVPVQAACMFHNTNPKELSSFPDDTKLYDNEADPGKAKLGPEWSVGITTHLSKLNEVLALAPQIYATNSHTTTFQKFLLANPVLTAFMDSTNAGTKLLRIAMVRRMHEAPLAEKVYIMSQIRQASLQLVVSKVHDAVVASHKDGDATPTRLVPRTMIESVVSGLVSATKHDGAAVVAKIEEVLFKTAIPEPPAQPAPLPPTPPATPAPAPPVAVTVQPLMNLMPPIVDMAAKKAAAMGANATASAKGEYRDLLCAEAREKLNTLTDTAAFVMRLCGSNAKDLKSLTMAMTKVDGVATSLKKLEKFDFHKKSAEKFAERVEQLTTGVELIDSVRVMFQAMVTDPRNVSLAQWKRTPFGDGAYRLNVWETFRRALKTFALETMMVLVMGRSNNDDSIPPEWTKLKTAMDAFANAIGFKMEGEHIDVTLPSAVDLKIADMSALELKTRVSQIVDLADAVLLERSAYQALVRAVKPTPAVEPIKPPQPLKFDLKNRMPDWGSLLQRAVEAENAAHAAVVRKSPALVFVAFDALERLRDALNTEYKTKKDKKGEYIDSLSEDAYRKEFEKLDAAVDSVKWATSEYVNDKGRSRTGTARRDETASEAAELAGALLRLDMAKFDNALRIRQATFKKTTLETHLATLRARGSDAADAADTAKGVIASLVVAVTAIEREMKEFADDTQVKRLQSEYDTLVAETKRKITNAQKAREFREDEARKKKLADDAAAATKAMQDAEEAALVAFDKGKAGPKVKIAWDATITGETMLDKDLETTYGPKTYRAALKAGLNILLRLDLIRALPDKRSWRQAKDIIEAIAQQVFFYNAVVAVNAKTDDDRARCGFYVARCAAEILRIVHKKDPMPTYPSEAWSTLDAKITAHFKTTRTPFSSLTSTPTGNVTSKEYGSLMNALLQFAKPGTGLAVEQQFWLNAMLFAYRETRSVPDWTALTKIHPTFPKLIVLERVNDILPLYKTGDAKIDAESELGQCERALEAAKPTFDKTLGDAKGVATFARIDVIDAGITAIPVYITLCQAIVDALKKSASVGGRSTSKSVATDAYVNELTTLKDKTLPDLIRKLTAEEKLRADDEKVAAEKTAFERKLAAAEGAKAYADIALITTALAALPGYILLCTNVVTASQESKAAGGRENTVLVQKTVDDLKEKLANTLPKLRSKLEAEEVLRQAEEKVTSKHADFNAKFQAAKGVKDFANIGDIDTGITALRSYIILCKAVVDAEAKSHAAGGRKTTLAFWTNTYVSELETAETKTLPELKTKVEAVNRLTVAKIAVANAKIAFEAALVTAKAAKTVAALGDIDAGLVALRAHIPLCKEVETAYYVAHRLDTSVTKDFTDTHVVDLETDLNDTLPTKRRMITAEEKLRVAEAALATAKSTFEAKLEAAKKASMQSDIANIDDVLNGINDYIGKVTDVVQAAKECATNGSAATGAVDQATVDDLIDQRDNKLPALKLQLVADHEALAMREHEAILNAFTKSKAALVKLRDEASAAYGKAPTTHSTPPAVLTAKDTKTSTDLAQALLDATEAVYTELEGGKLSWNVWVGKFGTTLKSTSVAKSAKDQAILDITTEMGASKDAYLAAVTKIVDACKKREALAAFADCLREANVIDEKLQRVIIAEAKSTREVAARLVTVEGTPGGEAAVVAAAGNALADAGTVADQVSAGMDLRTQVLRKLGEKKVDAGDAKKEVYKQLVELEKKTSANNDLETKALPRWKFVVPTQYQKIRCHQLAKEATHLMAAAGTTFERNNAETKYTDAAALCKTTIGTADTHVAADSTVMGGVKAAVEAVLHDLETAHTAFASKKVSDDEFFADCKKSLEKDNIALDGLDEAAMHASTSGIMAAIRGVSLVDVLGAARSPAAVNADYQDPMRQAADTMADLSNKLGAAVHCAAIKPAEFTVTRLNADTDCKNAHEFVAAHTRMMAALLQFRNEVAPFQLIVASNSAVVAHAEAMAAVGAPDSRATGAACDALLGKLDAAIVTVQACLDFPAANLRTGSTVDLRGEAVVTAAAALKVHLDAEEKATIEAKAALGVAAEIRASVSAIEGKMAAVTLLIQGGNDVVTREYDPIVAETDVTNSEANYMKLVQIMAKYNANAGVVNRDLGVVESELTDLTATRTDAAVGRDAGTLTLKNAIRDAGTWLDPTVVDVGTEMKLFAEVLDVEAKQIAATALIESYLLELHDDTKQGDASAAAAKVKTAADSVSANATGKTHEARATATVKKAEEERVRLDAAINGFAARCQSYRDAKADLESKLSVVVSSYEPFEQDDYTEFIDLEANIDSKILKTGNQSLEDSWKADLVDDQARATAALQLFAPLRDAIQAFDDKVRAVTVTPGDGKAAAAVAYTATSNSLPAEYRDRLEEEKKAIGVKLLNDFVVALSVHADAAPDADPRTTEAPLLAAINAALADDYLNADTDRKSALEARKDAHELNIEEVTRDQDARLLEYKRVAVEVGAIISSNAAKFQEATVTLPTLQETKVSAVDYNAASAAMNAACNAVRDAGRAVQLAISNYKRDVINAATGKISTARDEETKFDTDTDELQKLMKQKTAIDEQELTLTEIDSANETQVSQVEFKCLDADFDRVSAMPDGDDAAIQAKINAFDAIQTAGTSGRMNANFENTDIDSLLRRVESAKNATTSKLGQKARLEAFEKATNDATALLQAARDVFENQSPGRIRAFLDSVNGIDKKAPAESDRDLEFENLQIELRAILSLIYDTKSNCIDAAYEICQRALENHHAEDESSDAYRRCVKQRDTAGDPGEEDSEIRSQRRTALTSYHEACATFYDAQIPFHMQYAVSLRAAREFEKAKKTLEKVLLLTNVTYLSDDKNDNLKRVAQVEATRLKLEIEAEQAAATAKGERQSKYHAAAEAALLGNDRIAESLEDPVTAKLEEISGTTASGEMNVLLEASKQLGDVREILEQASLALTNRVLVGIKNAIDDKDVADDQLLAEYISLIQQKDRASPGGEIPRRIEERTAEVDTARADYETKGLDAGLAVAVGVPETDINAGILAAQALVDVERDSLCENAQTHFDDKILQQARTLLAKFNGLKNPMPAPAPPTSPQESKDADPQTLDDIVDIDFDEMAPETRAAAVQRLEKTLSEALDSDDTSLMLAAQVLLATANIIAKDDTDAVADQSAADEFRDLLKNMTAKGAGLYNTADEGQNIKTVTARMIAAGKGYTEARKAESSLNQRLEDAKKAGTTSLKEEKKTKDAEVLQLEADLAAAQVKRDALSIVLARASGVSTADGKADPGLRQIVEEY